ncbi:hypothetical protein [Microbacterium sp. WCS2018Hpa-9]|uniref:hypothetical protein n=1 Tax=Microbacterium sp. WCS2018Hpa-9 TaxID=3073635 RepID=UPI00288B56FB|nr:hypothetical protein [Microbacterium sp. WCS2018Hpa-9]
MTASAPPPPTGAELPRVTISRGASEAIDGWAWGLIDGSIRLWQLPQAVNTLWNLAFEQGQRSRDTEVEQLKLDADRMWLRAFADPERKQFLIDRLDQAADLANRPDVDDVLDEAWRIYLANLDTLREPVRLETTEDLGTTCDHAA